MEYFWEKWYTLALLAMFTGYIVYVRERERGEKKVNASKLKTVKSNYFTRMIKELNKSILELC